MTAEAAPHAAPARLDWRGSLPALAGLLAFGLLLLAPQLLNDGDTYWHIVAGGWMLDHGRVLKTDIFSYSRLGAPWETHEWLAEVLSALAFRAGGWSGVVTLHAAAAGLTAAILTAQLRKSLTGLALAATVVVAFACLAPSLLARPHLLALPILATWTAGLMQARAERRAPSFWLLPLMTLWANLHGGYVFGVALIGPFALEALLGSPGRGRQVVVGWGMFGLASIVAALITPFGVQGLLFPIKLLGMHSLAGVAEWAPADFARPGPLELSVLAALFVCLWKGARMPVVRLLTLLLLLHLSLQHARHQMLLAIVGAMLLAEPLGRALGEPSGPKPGGRGIWRWSLGAAAIAAGRAVVRLAAPMVRTDGASTPATALSHVPTALARQPVLNAYGFGGYLIFQGVRPFVDGRTDMYGDAFMDGYFKAMRPDVGALQALFEKYGVAWTILPPDDPVVSVLDHQPGWRRLYADKVAVVHVRQDAPGAPPMFASLAAP